MSELLHVSSSQISRKTNKLCKSYEQKNNHPRGRGKEIGQVFLAITHLANHAYQSLYNFSSFSLHL